MESKSNIRRLLAGSSLVALLAASGPALGAGTTISSPTGSVTVSNTIDFIQVTAGGIVGGDLTITSSGAIDLAAQGTSFVGVDINQGTVDGGILNQGTVGVAASSMGLPIGIAVRGSGASVGSTGTSFGIRNEGLVSVEGVNSAIGIAVYGPSSISFEDGINNATGGTIVVGAHQEAHSGSALAAGILVDISSGSFIGNINNDGLVAVSATELSAISNIEAATILPVTASGSARAIATGIGVGSQFSFAGMTSLNAPDLFSGDLTNSSGSIQVLAQADSTHTASATGRGGVFVGNANATAKGTDTTAQAYGMFVSALGIDGSVVNSAAVAGSANANSVNNAIAHGVQGGAPNTGNASALASGRAVATATGLLINANSMLGDLVNNGYVGMQAVANTTNVATADSTDSAAAKASALGDAYARAYGMSANAGSFIGNFVNSSSATLNVFATATAKNTATIVDPTQKYQSATALASSSVSATAYGMEGRFDTFGGLVVNDGAINVSAVGGAVNNATVHVQGPAVATVDNGEYSATADAVGMDVTGGLLIAASSTGVSQGGTIDVLAHASANQGAQATGTSFAQANSNADVVAGAGGVYIGVSSFLGNFVNDGGITVAALGTVSSAATAKATGVSAGLADANGNNFASARAHGINVNGQSFVGDFVNTVNGALDISATAKVFGTAKATGTSLNSAEATLYDRAYAKAGGIQIHSNSSFMGSISNAAVVTVDVLASTINHATALLRPAVRARLRLMLIWRPMHALMAWRLPSTA